MSVLWCDPVFISIMMIIIIKKKEKKKKKKKIIIIIIYSILLNSGQVTGINYILLICQLLS